MWIRMRFGISWRDLIAGLFYCVRPTSRFIAYHEAISAWSDRDDCLIALSVRSAFDQLLQRLALQEGDEVLMSAWTVPGMVRIVEAHGLVPVPVDVDCRGNVSLASMENAITSRSRVCIIAHLFGGHANLEEVIPVLKEREIFLVEDCAQSFVHVGEIGHPESDAVLHSFGPIKTATSLGGAVVRIPDSELRRKVTAGIAEQPVQSQLTFAKRVFRFAALKLLSGKFASRVMFGLLSRFNVDVDRMINSLGRGFTDSKILTQIRFQPATPLLRLMTRRFRNFDASEIDRRKRLGEIFDDEIGRDSPPADDSRWICPVFVPEPDCICKQLRSAGFDATTQSRMVVVPPADDRRVATIATNNWQSIVFLPWYPALDEASVRKMARLLRHSFQHRSQNDGAIVETWIEGNDATCEHAHSLEQISSQSIQKNVVEFAADKLD